MKEKLQKHDKWIYGCVSFLTLLFVAIALHDVQTSQGVGLYLSVKANADSRKWYDILVDIAAMVALMLLLAIPWYTLGQKKAASFLRFLAAFLAFAPQLSMAYLVHLFDTEGLLEIRPTLKSKEVMTALMEGSKQAMALFQIILPMLCLLLVALGIYGKILLKRWHYSFVIGCVLLAVGIFVFPGLGELLGFIMVYLLLVVMCDMWEKLIGKVPGLYQWSWILFGGLWLRGIYLLMELMSAYA